MNQGQKKGQKENTEGKAPCQKQESTTCTLPHCHSLHSQTCTYTVIYTQNWLPLAIYLTWRYTTGSPWTVLVIWSLTIKRDIRGSIGSLHKKSLPVNFSTKSGSTLYTPTHADNFSHQYTLLLHCIPHSRGGQFAAVSISTPQLNSAC